MHIAHRSLSFWSHRLAVLGARSLPSLLAALISIVVVSGCMHYQLSCCFCSALCGQPRFCMINYLRLYFWAPCAFSTQHPWDAFSTDSPGTWMRVRNLSLSFFTNPFKCRMTGASGSGLMSRSVLPLRSWRASGDASGNAAPERDVSAVLPGHGGRRVSLVPDLHLSFRGVPLHRQPHLQVWSYRFIGSNR